MDMEDNHHYHHHHQEQQQYGITDLRQLMNNGQRSTLFPTAELFPSGHHPNLTANTHHHYEMMMFGRQVADIMPRCLHDFASTDSPTTTAAAIAATPTTTTTSASTPPLSGLEAETAAVDGSTGRWPRQETLTLLEIRSRLHPKFKEANQKGPLWDEVSRIMCEEHGYQRNGKKCREKFENLYKYYKKTKEGKAGRQDGKHYRFFRQLEALYGENINNQASVPETNFGNNTLHFQTSQDMLTHSQNKHCDSLSLTNSTEFDTSSSEDNDQITKENDESIMEKRRKRNMSGRNWKVKIKDFIDFQLKKLVEKQEEWLEKLTKTLEQKERERVIREEEWRKQEAERLEKEHRFWAKERAWIEARDAALMEALQKLTGSEIKSTQIQSHEDESEILNAKDVNKKRKEESRSCFYFDNNNDHRSSLYNQLGGSYCCDMNDQREERGLRLQMNDGSSPSNSNAVVADNCFHPFLMSDQGGNLWENYSLKVVNKPNQNQ